MEIALHSESESRVNLIAKRLFMCSYEMRSNLISLDNRIFACRVQPRWLVSLSRFTNHKKNFTQSKYFPTNPDAASASEFKIQWGKSSQTINDTRRWTIWIVEQQWAVNRQLKMRNNKLNVTNKLNYPHRSWWKIFIPRYCKTFSSETETEGALWYFCGAFVSLRMTRGTLFQGPSPLSSKSQQASDFK